MVDRDDDDCLALKKRLEETAASVRLRTRSRAGARPWQLINRIVIEELEAWYFGDWAAVHSAYPRVSQAIPGQKRFRDPDAEGQNDGGGASAASTAYRSTNSEQPAEGMT